MRYATCVALGCSYVCTSVRAYRAQVCEPDARVGTRLSLLSSGRPDLFVVEAKTTRNTLKIGGRISEQVARTTGAQVQPSTRVAHGRADEQNRARERRERDEQQEVNAQAGARTCAAAARKKIPRATDTIDVGAPTRSLLLFLSLIHPFILDRNTWLRSKEHQASRATRHSNTQFSYSVCRVTIASRRSRATMTRTGVSSRWMPRTLRSCSRLPTQAPIKVSIRHSPSLDCALDDRSMD